MLSKNNGPTMPSTLSCLLITTVCLLNVGVARAQTTYWMGRIDNTDYVFDRQLPQSFGDAIVKANVSQFKVEKNLRGFDSLNASGTAYSLIKASVTSDWQMFENQLPRRSLSIVAKNGGGGAAGSWIHMETSDSLVNQFAQNLPRRERGQWFNAEVMMIVAPDANQPNVGLAVPKTTLAKNEMIRLSEHTLGGFYFPEVLRPTHIVPFRQAMLDYGNAGRQDPDFRKFNGSKTATDLSGDKTFVGERNQWETVTKDNPSAPYFADHVVNQQLTEAAQFQAEYQASIDSVTHDGPANFKGDSRLKEFGTRVGYFNGPSSAEACGAGGAGDFPHAWMVGETHFRPWFNVYGAVYQVGYGAAKSSRTGKWYFTAVVSGARPSESNLASNPNANATNQLANSGGQTQPMPGNGISGNTGGNSGESSNAKATPAWAAGQTKSTWEQGAAKITIYVTNKTGQAIESYWVDGDGKESGPSSIPAGAEKLELGFSYPGNLYRIKINGKLHHSWVIQTANPHLIIEK